MPLVGMPKAVWLARNFVWWSGWEGEGKGLVGTYFLWFGLGLGIGLRPGLGLDRVQKNRMWSTSKAVKDGRSFIKAYWPLIPDAGGGIK